MSARTGRAAALAVGVTAILSLVSPSVAAAASPPPTRELAAAVSASAIPDAAIAAAAKQAGFPSPQLATAVAVALAESGGRPDAVNWRDPYGGSHGLFQINGSHRGFPEWSRKYDPSANAKMAYRIWSGSHNWRAWGAYTNGSYLSYHRMQRGQAAAAKLGSSVSAPQSPRTTTTGGTTVVTRAYPHAYGSLSGLARAFCGSARRWPEIWRANPISNPNIIGIGVRVKVPCAGTAAAQPTAVARTSTTRWVSPLATMNLTSCFGWRTSTQSFHRGLDMSAPQGTTIRAVAAGTVTKVGWVWGGYGISTVISHGNGYWSHYAHQSSTSVRVGQRVAAGQSIGRVGHTGFVIASRGGDGSHLHFEIATSAGVLKAQINPSSFLRARGITVRGC